MSLVGNHSQANVKIEDLWMGLKAHADKELHPFEIHLRNLKVGLTYDMRIIRSTYDMIITANAIKRCTFL